jgi:hypothetical protein
VRPASWCTLDFVGYEESRQMHVTYDEAGKILDMQPLESSQQAFLDLRTPSGVIIRVQVAPADLEKLLSETKKDV